MKARSGSGYLICGFTVGRYYNWKVLPVSYSSTCLNTDSALAAVRTFSVIYATGIREAATDISTFYIFPNPVNFANNITAKIDIKESKAVTVLLADMQGKVVYSKMIALHNGINEWSIPVHLLTTGVYLYSVTAPDLKLTRRVTITKP